MQGDVGRYREIQGVDDEVVAWLGLGLGLGVGFGFGFGLSIISSCLANPNPNPNPNPNLNPDPNQATFDGRRLAQVVETVGARETLAMALATLKGHAHHQPRGHEEDTRRQAAHQRAELAGRARGDELLEERLRLGLGLGFGLGLGSRGQGSP